MFNDIAAADNPDDWPSGTKATIDSIIEDCTGETVPGSAGSESDGQDGGSETTTTTTAAEGT